MCWGGNGGWIYYKVSQDDMHTGKFHLNDYNELSITILYTRNVKKKSISRRTEKSILKPVHVHPELCFVTSDQQFILSLCILCFSVFRRIGNLVCEKHTKVISLTVTWEGRYGDSMLMSPTLHQFQRFLWNLLVSSAAFSCQTHPWTHERGFLATWLPGPGFGGPMIEAR